MKTPKLHAFRTLIRIRIRRQETLDKVRVDAQHELNRLIDAVKEAEETRQAAQECVERQNALIQKLTSPGGQFQIAEYLAQEDYLLLLKHKVVTEEQNVQNAEDAVTAQQSVLAQARMDAATNARQQARLEERVAAILEELNIKKMDNEDEEAEEAVVTRKLLKLRKTIQDAAVEGNA